MTLYNETSVEHYIEQGLTFHTHQDFESALSCYNQALRHNTRNPKLWFLLGTALYQLNRFKDAEYFLMKSLLENPDNLSTYENLAALYENTKNIHAARALCEKAIEIDPQYFSIYFHLIHIYFRFRQFDNALYLAKKLEEEYSNNGESNYYNLSKTYYYFSLLYDALEQHDLALHYSQLSLKFNKKNYMNRMQYNFMQMKLGHLRYIWNDFEIRHVQQPHHNVQKRLGGRWRGEVFKNKSLIILGEQGLGDIIQFIRFAKYVKDKGGRVYFSCSPKLFKLLKNIDGIDHCVDEKNIQLKCSYSIFLMSLLKPLQITEQSFPAFLPYIKADKKLIQKWAHRLSQDQFNIGIVWQGNSENGRDYFRSFKLSNFYPLSKVKNVQLISLQKNFGLEQINDCPADMNLMNWEDDIDAAGDAFVDTAAIIQNLDLVITIDSAIAHLAGAMGRPVWTVLGFGSDWRWMTKTNETPWYPSMRLFRQQIGEEPDVLFQRVADAVSNLVDLKFSQTITDPAMSKLKRA